MPPRGRFSSRWASLLRKIARARRRAFPGDTFIAVTPMERRRVPASIPVLRESDPNRPHLDRGHDGLVRRRACAGSATEFYGLVEIGSLALGIHARDA